MKAGDFDPQAGTVTVARSKSGKPRHVALTDEGRAFFARHRGRQAGLPPGCSSATRSVKQATTRRAGRDGAAAWGKSDQFRLMREACAAAKIAPAVSFHILRHTYASRPRDARRAHGGDRGAVGARRHAHDRTALRPSVAVLRRRDGARSVRHARHRAPATVAPLRAGAGRVMRGRSCRREVCTGVIRRRYDPNRRG